MSTQLPVAQIVSEYRQAKDKTKQVAILADLYVCKPHEIAQVLHDAGEKLPAVWRKKLMAESNTAPAGAIAVGKLLELLTDLPHGAEIRVEDRPLRGVCFARQYDAETDQIAQCVTLLL